MSGLRGLKFPSGGAKSLLRTSKEKHKRSSDFREEAIVVSPQGEDSPKGSKTPGRPRFSLEKPRKSYIADSNATTQGLCFENPTVESMLLQLDEDRKQSMFGQSKGQVEHLSKSLKRKAKKLGAHALATGTFLALANNLKPKPKLDLGFVTTNTDDNSVSENRNENDDESVDTSSRRRFEEDDDKVVEEYVPICLRPEESIADDFGMNLASFNQESLHPEYHRSPSMISRQTSERVDFSKFGEGETGDKKEAKEVLNNPEYEYKRPETVAFRPQTANITRLNSTDEELRIAHGLKLKYEREYLNQHPLDTLFDAFASLDNTLNLFFHTYSSLKRSSYICARVWIYLMKIRMLMQDSMAHLTDEPQLLAPCFIDSRRVQTTFIREAIKVVARAVQFIAVYAKHSEIWRFYRRPFFVQMSYRISLEANSIAEGWYKLEVKLNGLSKDGLVANSYQVHLDLEEVRIVRSLLEVSQQSIAGKNDKKCVKSLGHMVRDLNSLREIDPSKRLSENLEDFPHRDRVAPLVEDDLKLFRVQISMVKDIQDMFNKFDDILPRTETFKLEFIELENALNFLHDEFDSAAYKNILKEDMKLWPHQKGIQQIGPFRLVVLKDASDYFALNFANKTYAFKSEIQIEGMDFYNDLSGSFTELKRVTFDKAKDRRNLKIPKDAYYFSYFFPLDYDKEYINQVYTQAKYQIHKKTIAKIQREISPIHALVVDGGFGYFNKRKQLISLNGFTKGEDIFFDGPYFLPSNEGFKRIQEKNIPIAAITTQEELLSQHAINRCWVSSEEQLNNFSLDGKSKVFNPPESGDTILAQFKGAFLYQYDNSEHPEWNEDGRYEGGRRNYFQLIRFEELYLQKVKNRNTLLLQNLKYYIKKALSNNDWEVLKLHKEINEFNQEEEEVQAQSTGLFCCFPTLDTK